MAEYPVYWDKKALSSVLVEADSPEEALEIVKEQLLSGDVALEDDASYDEEGYENVVDSVRLTPTVRK